jgi:hypothetical protein
MGSSSTVGDAARGARGVQIAERLFSGARDGLGVTWSDRDSESQGSRIGQGERAEQQHSSTSSCPYPS